LLSLRRVHHLRRLLRLGLLPLVLRLTECSHECTPGDSHCLAGNTLQYCTTVYNSSQWFQAPCDPDVCVTAEGQSFCSPSSSPQAVCQGVADDAVHDPFVCSRNAPSICIGGYVAPQDSCGVGTCRVAPEGQPACAFCDSEGSSFVDPACAGGVQEVCEGNAIVECECGYQVQPFGSLSCAPKQCVMIDGAPDCQ
jgi:hypothetical protein